MAQAIADPFILDVVELPTSEQGEPCPCRTRSADGPTVCGDRAKFVFVYDGRYGKDELKPKNSLACEECAPGPSDGGFSRPIAELVSGDAAV